MRAISVAIVFVFAGATAVYAAAPSIGEILPRGAARGGVAEIDIVGGNLADAVDLMFHDEGIKLIELAPEANKVHCKLEIAPDCRLGTHAIRVRTKSGLSNLRLFSVGALQEINEAEPNNDPDAAATLALGTTINGDIPNEDVDYYAVELAEGGRLSAEVEAMRLGGSLFDAKVRVFDPTGHELVAEDDTALLHQDAGFVFTAREAGRYVVAVSEAAYGGGGGFYYRLHLGQFPRPLAVTPMGGQPGAEVSVTWLGDPGLTAQTVGTPADSLGATVLTPASDLGVAPTGVPFRLSDLPGALETEPNNVREEATAASAPGAMDGVIGEAGDVDWFKFEGTAGQVYDVRVYARDMGSPLDSVLTIYHPSGGAIAGNDDAVGADSLARITLGETGTHTLSITDHLSSGGPTFAYRIEVAPVKPSLAFSFLENEHGMVNVPEGGRGFVLLQASRAEFDGPLGLTVEGLPEGVTADFDAFPAGQGVMPVVFTATPEAPVAGALPSITGKLEQEGTDVQGAIKHAVNLIYGDNKVVFWSREVKRLAMSVSEPAPFTIDLVQPKAPLIQNGAMNLKVVVTRAEGFNAKIALRVPWVSPGVSAGTGEIAEGATEGTVLLNANGNAAVGAFRFAVLASSSGYDVSTALTPINIASPWVTFNVAEVQTEQGKPVQLDVEVAQAQAYDGSFKAELLGLPKGVTTQPQDITKDTTKLSFPLEVAADAPEGKFGGLFVRSVLSTEGEDVLHQSGGGTLQVFKPLPPTLAQAEPAPEEKPKEEPKAEEPKRKTRFPAST